MTSLQGDEPSQIDPSAQWAAARMSALRRAAHVAACALLFAAATVAPKVAEANVFGDRFEFGMYGRAGAAWTLSGVAVNGRTMNLFNGPAQLGGRLGEGDYLEPTLQANIVKGEKEDALDIQAKLTLGMFTRTGSFISLLTNNASQTVEIEVFQAYAEAKNVFLPSLTFWGGVRQYRGTNIDIADYFYFNNLTGQGGGVKYKGLDVAWILQTAGSGGLYNADVDVPPDGVLEQRQRSCFIAQYSHILGPRESTIHGLAELHVLPALKRVDTDTALPTDHGFAAGVKYHLDLGDGKFNDMSVRFGSRIANGAAGGAPTYNTFGAPDSNGTYEGGYGLELVEHFLWNFGQIFTLNAHASFHLNKGGEGIAADKELDFAANARGTIYAHDYFHLLAEVGYQGRKNGDDPIGTVFKASVAPTIVPRGERSVWSRPHFRFIYTAGFYNKQAADNLMSSFLQAVGPTRYTHYFGTRAEWWF